MQWRPRLQFCCPDAVVREELSAVRAQSWAPRSQKDMGGGAGASVEEGRKL